MEYYSAIIRNKFESVLVRWMNLKPATQSKVRKTNLYINAYIQNLENGTNGPICGAGIEMQT